MPERETLDPSYWGLTKPYIGTERDRVRMLEQERAAVREWIESPPATGESYPMAQRSLRRRLELHREKTS